MLHPLPSHFIDSSKLFKFVHLSLPICTHTFKTSACWNVMHLKVFFKKVIGSCLIWGMHVHATIKNYEGNNVVKC
jgi:hypothetical protein